MSIEFNCQSCGKPIEIDDANAGKKVMCYYCQQIVDAPAISQADTAVTETTGKTQSYWAGVIGLLAAIACVTLLVIVIGWTIKEILPVVTDADFLSQPKERQMEILAEATSIIKTDASQSIGLIWLGVIASAVIGLLSSILAIVKNAGRTCGVFGLVILAMPISLFVLALLMKGAIGS